VQIYAELRVKLRFFHSDDTNFKAPLLDI